VSVRRIPALVAIVTAFLCARDAHAQTSPSSPPGRFELSAGGLWMGHQLLGGNGASETTGTGGSLKIFTTSSDLAGARGVEARVAVRVLGSLEADVEASYAKPRLTISISNDIENAPPVTAVETIQQLTVGAGVVWPLPVRVATRLAPFVTAGGGYLRQVHEGATLIQTGRYYQFGGGVKYLLFSRPRGFVHAIGARVDVRAVVRAKGVAFDDRGHASPAVGASAFVRF
jgi:hypothetical protein